MGLFTEEIQKTSVSLYIERLSNLEEIDWYLLQQLTESIQMQSTGAREAVETVRKKLKHGGKQQKLRVLEILQLLMENSNQQFHKQFLANEKLKERFELIITSPTETAEVKNTLLSLLGAWSVKYKSEPGMRAIGDLYDLGRGKKRMQIRTNTAETGRTNSAAQSPTVQSPTVQSPTNIVPTSPIRSPKPKEPSRHQSLPPPKKDPKPVTKPRSQSNGDRSQFNFEKTKPKIMQEVALANQNSNNLLNALRLINTSEDRWEIDLQYDARLQEYRNRCEDSRKKIVRYVRLVEDEEWIGTLLKANEDLLKGLDMYDVMLTGEIPVVWQPKESNKMIRAPPPPPPPTRTSPPLQIELGNLRINDTQHEELDPFADPTTPVEETHAY